MITPIFIPMNYGSGYFDISSVHHPIILLGFVVFPILLTFLFIGAGLAAMAFDEGNITNVSMKIGTVFFGFVVLGFVFFILFELFSCI